MGNFALPVAISGNTEVVIWSPLVMMVLESRAGKFKDDEVQEVEIGHQDIFISYSLYALMAFSFI